MKTGPIRRNAAVLRFVALITTFCLAGLPGTVVAEDQFPNFESLRRHHVRATFEAVSEYLTRRPDADDAVEAYRYLLKTALEQDLTREAQPHAVEFLKSHPDAGLGDKSLARRVAMTALALAGETDAAIEVLGEELAAVRRVDPSAAIDAATGLAAAVQRGGKPDQAKQVYERLRRAFFLNPGVESIVENRLSRLELLGKEMPEIGLTDLNENPPDQADLEGRIVLVDFWATNCPPCLEELPQLRRLYADHHKQGFEILAISLDEDEALVREFLARYSTPWPVFLSSGDNDETRERFHVETIPANFLIGPDGRVSRVDLHGADLRAEVERLVKERQGRKEP